MASIVGSDEGAGDRDRLCSDGVGTRVLRWGDVVAGRALGGCASVGRRARRDSAVGHAPGGLDQSGGVSQSNNLLTSYRKR